jgi:hypothetical protein
MTRNGNSNTLLFLPWNNDPIDQLLLEMYYGRYSLTNYYHRSIIMLMTPYFIAWADLAI